MSKRSKTPAQFLILLLIFFSISTGGISADPKLPGDVPDPLDRIYLEPIDTGEATDDTSLETAVSNPFTTPFCPFCRFS